MFLKFILDENDHLGLGVESDIILDIKLSAIHGNKIIYFVLALVCIIMTFYVLLRNSVQCLTIVQHVYNIYIFTSIIGYFMQ